MNTSPKPRPEQAEALLSHTAMLLKGVFNDYFSMLSEACRSFSPENVSLPVSRDLARKLLNHGGPFTDALVDSVRDNFNRYLAPPETAKKSTRKLGKKQRQQVLEARLSKLKLLETDELEKQLLVSSTVSRLIGDFDNELASLNLRIEHIMRHELEKALLPVAPRYLFDSLVKATDVIPHKEEEEAPIVTALADVLADNYELLLEGLNDFLIRRNILPDLDEAALEYRYDETHKLETSKRKRKETLTRLVDKTPDEAETLSDTELRSALTHLIKNAAANPALKAHLLKPVDNGVLASPEEFVEGFTRKLTLPKLSEPDTGYVQDVPSAPLSEQVNQYMEETHVTLEENEASTVSMLSLLFDRVNQDTSVTDEMKSLLNYLKGPMMKAALLDPTFFSDTDNPAQRLMDTIADVGATWTPADNRKRDSLYNKIAAIIERVNHEFDDDYEVFEECQQDLDLFIKAEKRRARLIEERLIAAEKAKARTRTARKVAGEHVRKILSTRHLARSVNDFFQGPWEQTLFYIHNKEESTESSSWQNAMDLEKDLLKALTQGDPGAQESLLSRLEQKLDYAGIPANDIRNWLDKLAHEFNAVNHLSDQYLVEEVDMEDIFPLSENESSPPLPEVDETPVADEREPVTDAEAEPDEYDVMAADLTPNAWVRQKEADGKETKVRVAAIVKATDTVVLVNRNGSRSQAVPRKEFARRLREGKMTIIENGMMFDRALESVIQNLRS